MYSGAKLSVDMSELLLGLRGARSFVMPQAVSGQVAAGRGMSRPVVFSIDDTIYGPAIRKQVGVMAFDEVKSWRLDACNFNNGIRGITTLGNLCVLIFCHHSLPSL